MGDRGTLTADALVKAFDAHLEKARGANGVSRRSYARYVRAFLEDVSGEGPLEVTAFSAPEVLGFFSSLVARYRPRTLAKVATVLRSFFRFLRMEGLRHDCLEQVVPSVACRRLLEIPRHLDEGELEQLLSSLDVSTPRARRDSAIVLCLARLGLRCGEVVGMRLDDIDWQRGVLRIPVRKAGHGALLPLPQDVGRALVAYLRDGRPPTSSRHVFVLHHLRVGAPTSQRVVYVAVSNALRRAGIEAPMRGPHLLRHTLATCLIRRGASLKEIADLLGHRRLESTQIYAKLDLASLREVAVPWPEIRS